MKITLRQSPLLILSLLALIFVLPQYPTRITLSDANAASTSSPVYRFYSGTYKHHFYTISAAEKESIQANDANWAYEGIAYYAFPTEQSDSEPLYRFYSENYKGHFYTNSEAEKKHIIEFDTNWRFEGVAYYTQKSGMPIYRFYSPRFQGHFYTTAEAEKQHLIDNDPNWVFEGVVFYGGTAAEDEEIAEEVTFCGVDHGQSLSTRPANTLCTGGMTATQQTGNGPWQWACADAGGAIVSICKALPLSSSPEVIGQCGASVDTCAVGAFVDAEDTISHNNWGCIGSGGHGTFAECATPR